ncbi:MAG: hypothetical protein WBP93_04700, partial [Pyrinomonadaceae bacterium]
MSRATKSNAYALVVTLLFGFTLSGTILGQQRAAEEKGSVEVSSNQRGPVRPVTIPITFRKRGSKPISEVQPIEEFSVKEDGEAQQVISIRDIGSAPLSFAVLIQDNVVSSIGNEIASIADFIRRLPRGSRVFVGYMRPGTIEVRQKFTTDLEKAASSLRIPVGSATAGPSNPYIEIREALKRFESLPAGRRAMLVVSDGLDISRGFNFGVAQSIDLDRAVKDAQRRSVAIYSIYAPTEGATSGNNSRLIADAQGSLDKLSAETGGRAYFHGTGVPVSFDPFIKEVGSSLARQIALTYLSTHPNKGYHRIEIRSGTPEIVIDHPAGY